MSMQSEASLSFQYKINQSESVLSFSKQIKNESVSNVRFSEAICRHFCSAFYLSWPLFGFLTIDLFCPFWVFLTLVAIFSLCCGHLLGHYSFFTIFVTFWIMYVTHFHRYWPNLTGFHTNLWLSLKLHFMHFSTSNIKDLPVRTDAYNSILLWYQNCSMNFFRTPFHFV